MADDRELFRYEQLAERSIKAQENSVAVAQSLLEVSRNLQGNLKELNDKFVFHSQATDDVKKDVKEIRETFMKWLKITIIAIFVLLGGTTSLRLLNEVDWTKILKF